MRSIKPNHVIAGLGVVAALGGPTVALAATDTAAPLGAAALTAPFTGKDDVAGEMRRIAHRSLVDQTVRLARREARLGGDHLRSGYRHAVAGWSNERLGRKQRSLRRQIRELKRTGTPASAQMQAIAACESGGNPRAIGGGGLYRGKYQMTYSSWAAVGGHGDPAAAPEAEQDRRAAALMARSGAGQWPVCGQ